jgi:hypothetical protein
MTIHGELDRMEEKLAVAYFKLLELHACGGTEKYTNEI